MNCASAPSTAGLKKSGLSRPRRTACVPSEKPSPPAIRCRSTSSLRFLLGQRALRIAQFPIEIGEAGLRLAQLRLSASASCAVRNSRSASGAVELGLRVAQAVGELRKGKRELLEFAGKNAQPRLGAVALLRDARRSARAAR